MQSRTAAAVVALAVGLAAAPAIAAGPTEGENVRITIQISAAEGNRERAPGVYQVVAQLGEQVQLTVGNRIPVPAVTFPTGDPAATPATSYSYQNVGLTGRVTTREYTAGRIRLEGELQASMLHDATSPPVIGTYNLQWTVLLEEGRTTRVTEIATPGSGPYFVDVRAERLN